VTLQSVARLPATSSFSGSIVRQKSECRRLHGIIVRSMFHVVRLAGVAMTQLSQFCMPAAAWLLNSLFHEFLKRKEYQDKPSCCYFQAFPELWPREDKHCHQTRPTAHGPRPTFLQGPPYTYTDACTRTTNILPPSQWVLLLRIRLYLSLGALQTTFTVS
jgi:hypothetical protein